MNSLQMRASQQSRKIKLRYKKKFLFWQQRDDEMNGTYLEHINSLDFQISKA